MTEAADIKASIEAASHLPKHTVYIVINGSLEMSPGKIQAQTFQVAERLFRAAEADPTVAELIARWRATHTKTITRIAKTQLLFDRCVAEVPGVVMVDEGKNEVEAGTQTMFATYPVDRTGPQPKILAHKKIPMYKGEG